MSKLTARDLAQGIRDSAIDLHDFSHNAKAEEWLELLVSAVLDKPAPASELGEAVVAAETILQNLADFVKICPDSEAAHIAQNGEDVIVARNILALAAENERLKQQMENDRQYQIEICHDCAVKIETKVREDLREQGWTAIADGLPEKGGLYDVALWHPGGSKHTASPGKIIFNGDNWETNSPLYVVYAWRNPTPLPEPPEPGDE